MTISEELQVLSVLDAIEANSRVSQRELSRTTGLNLAKINQLLKKLAEKDVVKLHSIFLNSNKLRYMYVLTPNGFAEKSRLTVRFAARARLQYNEAVSRLLLRFLQLRKSGVGRVLLVGSNEVTDMVMEAIENIEGLAIVALVDPKRAGQAHRGYPVVAHCEIEELDFDRLISCEDGDFSVDDIASRIGVAKEKVWLI
jgi:DNA-binding Lrp family transcriptional regulator